MITTNTGAKKIEGTDNWRGIFDAHNDSVDAHDQAIANLQNQAVYYGTCDTAAATAAKVATVSGFPSALVAGQKVAILFTYANSVANPTLNVNSLGAKSIIRLASGAVEGEWNGNELVEFVYDGTDWKIVRGGHATTARFGATKLTSDLTGTSENLALTQKAGNTLNDKIESHRKGGNASVVLYAGFWLIVTRYNAQVNSMWIAYVYGESSMGSKEVFNTGSVSIAMQNNYTLTANGNVSTIRAIFIGW